MCIFTGDIKEVSDTRIFSRLDGSRQAIVYEMFLSSDIDTAMVLPIPVSLETTQNPVEFIDLSEYEHFFDDVEFLFPKLRSRSLSLSLPVSASPTLEVKQVGAYEASFVPTQKDFQRLDPRFSLNDDLFEKLPEYRNYGFVVFKLRKGDSQVHPMAFWFNTQKQDMFYFPTVHIHQGEVPETENFNHTIYVQGTLKNTKGFIKSELKGCTELLKSISTKSKGIVDERSIIHKKVIEGTHLNKDIWIN